MTPQMVLVTALVYVILGRWIVSLRVRGADVAFALLNIAAVYLFFFYGIDPRFTLLFNLCFVLYVLLVSAQYVAMRLWSDRPGFLPWIAFSIPIVLLIVIRYMPVVQLAGHFSGTIRNVLVRHPEFALSFIFVGISYLAFRTSHLVLEVRNGVVPQPSYWQYLGFAFFAPTLSVGPISPYSQHRRAFTDTDKPRIPIGQAMLRVLVGAIKFRFLGPLLNQLTYSGLLLDGHPHHWIDLLVAIFAYYLYLYCNFSGFCDIAIGSAGLMGISVAENFANPFAARNMREFWNRWHITLSHYMRDIVFSPLSKALVRLFGPARVNQAIAVTIFVVFLLIGIWHGVGWNYAAFGAAHGFGVMTNHFYTLSLKKRLGKAGFAAYNKNRLIHAAAVTMTFLFAAAALFLFANTFSEMKTIFELLQWR